MEHIEYLQTPIGTLRIESCGGALRAVRKVDGPGGDAAPDALTNRAAAEIGEYFAGVRRRFDLPLRPAGTDFQRAVWRALSGIPYGGTVSYGEIARRLGMPSASRAVGGAVGANPLLILIPCHRVIRADGAAGGFSAGADAKRILLKLEGLPF